MARFVHVLLLTLFPGVKRSNAKGQDYRVLFKETISSCLDLVGRTDFTQDGPPLVFIGLKDASPCFIDPTPNPEFGPVELRRSVLYLQMCTIASAQDRFQEAMLAKYATWQSGEEYEPGELPNFTPTVKDVAKDTVFCRSYPGLVHTNNAVSRAYEKASGASWKADLPKQTVEAETAPATRGPSRKAKGKGRAIEEEEEEEEWEAPRSRASSSRGQSERTQGRLRR